MKRSILVIAPFLPVPPDFGGAIRVFYLVRELASDHEVIVVAPVTAWESEAVRMLGTVCDVVAVPSRLTARHGSGVRKRLAQARSVVSRRSFLETAAWSSQMQAAVDRVFLTRSVDVVQHEFPQSALFRPPRPCPTVLDAHNIEHELLERVARTSDSVVATILKRQEARKVRGLERRVWRQATVCVATSDRDAQAIASHTAETPIVVPNGVDAEAFARPRFAPRLPAHVVFTGAMRHQPNVDGAAWYVERVHPIVRRSVPEATVAIVGADPPPSVQRLQSESVTVTGWVDDVRPYLHEASAAIVPLLSGSGTRLKIVEAWAAGTPVVSTPVGAEGLDARHEHDLLLASEPEAFAEQVVRALRDRELAAGIAERALYRARAELDWSVVSKRLVAAHERAIELRTDRHGQ